MDFPEKEPGTGQAGSKFSVISFILLLLLIMSIAFLVYLKNQNVEMSAAGVKDFINGIFLDKSQRSPAERLVSQFEYDSKEHPVFDVYKDTIIKCTKDNIMCLNKKGEVLWTKSVSLSNPLIRVSGSNVLIADINGRFLYAINGKEIKWDKKVDASILSADINEKGYISVVKEMKGYKGAIEAYDSEGNWIFTTAKGDYFILSSKVLPSCDGVIVSMLDTSGISADSRFEFINTAGKTLGNVAEDNEIFTSIWPLKGDNVMAVSGTEAMIFNKDKKIKWKQQYEKIYSSQEFMSKGGAIAVREKNDKGVFSVGKTTVKVVDTNGHVSGGYVVDGDVLNMETYGSTIAVNTGREIFFINSKGRLLGKYTSKADILDVKFFNKDEVAVITKSSIVVTKII